MTSRHTKTPRDRHGQPSGRGGAEREQRAACPACNARSPAIAALAREPERTAGSGDARTTPGRADPAVSLFGVKMRWITWPSRAAHSHRTERRSLAGAWSWLRGGWVGPQPCYSAGSRASHTNPSPEAAPSSTGWGWSLDAQPPMALTTALPYTSRRQGDAELRATPARWPPNTAPPASTSSHKLLRQQQHHGG